MSWTAMRRAWRSSRCSAWCRAADSLVRYGRNPEAYWHRVLASQMGKFFEGRAMPPEVAAFVDACRRE
jgi:hypothetical protein